MIDFAEKFILITGGSKGIGKACVQAFSERNASVIFTYRKYDQSVEELLDGGRNKYVTALKYDAIDVASYAPLIQEIDKITEGKLDVLVNNVGDALKRSSFENSGMDLWQQSIDINLMTVVRSTYAFLPFLRASGNGVVVNISSIAGTTTGAGDSLHYGVTKAAVDVFTKGLAREMKDGKVRIVGVAPSAIDTDFQTRHSSAERLKTIVNQTPIGRIGTPEEVANMVLFVASSEASLISGETILMTGGR
jgi:3-oxoacyl-[acyl-carrier protein] reductase